MGNKNPNRKGLTPWKKGQSGNPAGKQKRLPELDEILADVLSEVNQNGKTHAEMIIKSLLLQVSKGNVRAAEVLLDRAYGKAKQTITGEIDLGPTPINIQVEITNDVRGDKNKG